MQTSFTPLALACCGAEGATSSNLAKNQDLLSFREPNESLDAHLRVIAGTLSKAKKTHHNQKLAPHWTTND
jgi:hypothetical protein